MSLAATRPELINSVCVTCEGECLSACFNDAIVFEDGLGYRVIADNCAGCGACTAACDPGLIYLDEGIARIDDYQGVS